MIDWVKAVRADELRKNAGDPGPVLAHRLSNSEYNYTIRDLTGVDIRPTKEFPVDPANQAGFDNTGEIAEHVAGACSTSIWQRRGKWPIIWLSRRTGLSSRPGPVLSETDRDQFAIKRIVDFYESQPTDYADYFEAAWRYKHRAVALGKPAATLTSTATDKQSEPEVSADDLGDSGENVAPSASLASGSRTDRASFRRCGRLCLARAASRLNDDEAAPFARNALRCAIS